MKSAAKMMLTTLLVAAAGALSATPAQADGHHTEQLNAQFMPSTRTRAEVRAELLAALRAVTTLRNGHVANRVQSQVAATFASH